MQSADAPVRALGRLQKVIVCQKVRRVHSDEPAATALRLNRAPVYSLR